MSKASEAGATAIKQINLVIGDMSSVVDDCVQFYFDFLSKDTLAQGARLSFKRIPIKVRCRQCSHEFTPAAEDWKCPQCESTGIEVIGGSEFFLESI